MLFGALILSLAMPVSAIDDTCKNGLCMQEDEPALSLLQTKAKKMMTATAATAATATDATATSTQLEAANSTQLEAAVEYSDLGVGQCRYQPPTPPTPILKAEKPKFAYKGQEGSKCQALCNADEKCGAYTNDDVNNCILWLEPSSGIIGGGHNWGNGHCHVKEKAGYKDLGEGCCLFQPVAPTPPKPKPTKVAKFQYKSQEGRDCRKLCDAEKECGGYTNDDVNNCILWEGSGLIGGGGNWGNGHCYVKK